MTTATQRVGALAIGLAALALAVFVMAALPAGAAGYGTMQNRERPFLSGPVCLEIDQASQVDGGLGQVDWCSYNSVQQQWIAVAVPNTTYYQLMNVHSNRCLEVSGGLFADGTRTIQNDCTTAREHQLWRFVQVDGSPWHEVVNRRTGTCLTNLGWNALQYDCDGSSTQHWTRPF